MTHKTRIAMIGCGGMARYHIREIMQQADGSEIAVMCEPSEAAYAASAQRPAVPGRRVGAAAQ
jgi:ornithine cyclodeaminase/alanine dehydrogenase-like protein (mu-crystallin family)